MKRFIVNCKTNVLFCSNCFDRILYVDKQIDLITFNNLMSLRSKTKSK